MLDTKTKGQFAKDLTQWKGLLEPLVVDEEVQIDMIYDLQEYCEKKGKGDQILGIVRALYDEDLIEEDVLFRWEKQARDEGETKYVRFLEPFLTWLREADEEESSDDEE